MKIPFFSFEHTHSEIKPEVLRVFNEFYDSNWYVLGKFTEQFERKYAQFNKVAHCVGVSTGLDALHLSLKALGIGLGDEVIVPSNTYIATVLAVSYTGATPVFVEPRWETANLNPELIEQAITKKTKCIMPVHLYGQACEMEAIMKIAKDNQLFVVEDNAQAHGATYNGKLTGAFGDINATSFYPTKNIGALGEAGAITTNNKNLSDQVRVLRNYGSEKRYYNEVIGYNNRIDEFEAAYLTVVLDNIEKWTKARQVIANQYREALSGMKEVTCLDLAKGATSVNHLFIIKTDKRDELRNYLSEKGVGTQIHYPVPPHLQKAYQHLGYKSGNFPIAEKLAANCLSLPIWPGITKNNIEFITDLINTFCDHNV